MHFYPPPLLLYCDTKILANASFWKCAGKLTPYHLKSGCRQLWLHFRTLIDRFNSFLETEGHSDHRKPMWTVNLVMRRSSQSTNLWTDIQEDEVSFCRSHTDCLWWNLQCRLSADTYVADIQFTSRPQIFQQLPEPLMGIWTALSPCEMVQGAFVWPQRWSNTAPDQTAGKGIPKLQEQQTHMQHTLVAIQRRSIKWLIKSENIILLE